MQTIDSIRRTNELSKVLKQHGFAEDSFQAVHQAQEAIGSESDVLDYESPAASDDRLLQKIANLERSKHLLAARVDELQQAHKASHEQFKQILSRLDGAEAKLRALRIQPAHAETSSVAPTVQTPAEPAPMSQPAAPEPAAQERHPRQAKTVDDSISIENVFYCGTR